MKTEDIPKIEFITFCDYALISQENKFSIIGMFDELIVKEYPGGIASAFLVAILKGKPNTRYQLDVLGDMDKENIFPPIDLDVKTGPGGVSNITINLTNMGFPKEGEYLFKIKQKNQTIGQTILTVADGEDKSYVN